MKKWNALAEKEKVRYEKEMSTYVPMEEPGGKKKKAKKDPNAPMEAPKTYAEGQSAHRYTPEERAALEEQKKKNIEAAQSKRKIYLRVPYKEKKTAIGFGAFFDTARVRWAIAVFFSL